MKPRLAEPGRGTLDSFLLANLPAAHMAGAANGLPAASEIINGDEDPDSRGARRGPLRAENTFIERAARSRAGLPGMRYLSQRDPSRFRRDRCPGCGRRCISRPHDDD